MKTGGMGFPCVPRIYLLLWQKSGIGLFLVFFPLLALSCSRIGDYARERADKAAYAIVADKQMTALGRADPFSIEDSHDDVSSRLLKESRRLDLAAENFTTPTTTITLTEAMVAALANSRDFRSRRESLYMQALSLTESRRNFETIFSGSAAASVSRTETTLAEGETNVDWLGSRGLSLGASRLLATGARLSLDFSHSFARALRGENNPSASNGLAFSVTQPLLRGAGSLVTQEGLRLAERSMIYSVRDFRRYQQGFIIQVAEQYFNLLSARDQLQNAIKNHVNTLDNMRKLEMFAAGERATSLEVDQASQAVLEAESRLNTVRLDYAGRLDRFKIFLGLPLDLDIAPDPSELEKLSIQGLIQPDISLREAIQTALNNRLDYLNALDQLEDTRRAVRIALLDFLPNLDFAYSYGTQTGDDKDRVRLDFDNSQHRWSLDLGLPFDWTPRRNNYRRALISLEQSRRSVDLFRENLTLEVRDSWRALDEARTSYRIQLERARLAERQVERASMFLERGSATVRDLLEAEDAMLSSRNAVTSALIAHTFQRMRFWNTIERFEIDEQGLWIEQNPSLP